MSLKLDDSALSTQVNSQKNLRVCILRIYEPETRGYMIVHCQHKSIVRKTSGYV